MVIIKKENEKGEFIMEDQPPSGFDLTPLYGKWGKDLPDLQRRNADLDQNDNRSWANVSPYKDVLPSVLKRQEAGNHYKDGTIQPIEFITSNNLSFVVGNIIKYAYRADKKGGAEDLKKCLHYCQIELETKYGIRSEVKYQE